MAGLVADGLVDGHAAVRERRVVLTLRGRLLADTVVRACSGCEHGAGGARVGQRVAAHLTNCGVSGGLYHSPLLAFTMPMMCTMTAKIHAAAKVTKPTQHEHQRAAR